MYPCQGSSRDACVLVSPIITDLLSNFYIAIALEEICVEELSDVCSQELLNTFVISSILDKRNIRVVLGSGYLARG